MSSKCFITFLNTTAQTEHSGFNPKTLPAVCAPPVSYTHLDVYKRQKTGWNEGFHGYDERATRTLGEGRCRQTPVSTVYIFGAGASKHIGYPLISEMGTEMLEWMTAYPNGYFRSAAEVVAQHFGRRRISRT